MQPDVAPTGTRLVVGVGGSGKTHLLDSLAAQLDAEGVAVVRVAGDPTLGHLCAVARSLGRPAEVGSGGPVPDPTNLAEALAAATGPHGTVAADDLHLLDEMSLAALRLHVDGGGTVVGAMRPVAPSGGLAELAQVLGRTSAAHHLDALSHDDLAAAVAGWTDSPAASELVDALLELSGGNPGLANDLVVSGFLRPDEPLPRVAADRILLRLRRTAPDAQALAGALAMGASLPDAVVAQVAGIAVDDLAVAADELRCAGLAEPDDDRLVPVVARALTESWGPAERRRRHAATAAALLAAGFDDDTAAQHLRDAGAGGPEAAQVFLAAGDRIRWRRPSDALRWYDHALAAGALPSAAAVGRAEAALATGAPDVRILVDQLDRDHPGQRARARVVLAALDALDARPDRAVERLLGADGHPEIAPSALRLLAVPFLVALGRYDEARDLSTGSQVDDLDATQRLAGLLADGALRALDGADPVPLLVEAAELYERTPPPMPTVLTPHALAAAHAELIGDFAVGESLLARAVTVRAGGEAGVLHHQLLQAWIRFRQGRHDTAARLVSELDRRTLCPRDALLLAALDAGLARRTGDVARLQDCWAGVEEAMLRQTVDLTTVGPVGELVLAAARLGQADRAEAVERQIDAVVDVANPAVPPAWTAARYWHRVQLAVVADLSSAAESAADALAGLPSPDGDRPRAFASAVTVASRCWADLLVDTVDVDRVARAVDALHEAQLPWDAARLAGQAALRVTDAGTARSLLERARTLKTPLPDPDVARAPDSPLSEREQEVAALLVDGLTHKEIGAQLYISAKTVEHHVARIRQKLGAGSRAELLAALRELV